MVTRTKVIGHIFDLFKEDRFGSFDLLARAIVDESSLASESTSFQIVRAGDIGLDSEGRFRGEEFIYSRTIFDCDRIELKGTSKVNLQDCIFMGTLQVSNVDELPSTTYIDTCIARTGIQIVGPCEHESVSFVSVSSPKLLIENLRCKSISLASSTFATTVVNEVACEELRVYDSALGFFEFSQSTADKVSMPYGQFCISSQGIKHQQDLEQLQSSFNPLAIRQRMDMDEWINRIQRTNRLETYDFLLSQTDARKDRRESADLKYLKAVVQSTSRIERWLVVATGALVKPARLILVAAGIIMAFAFLYWAYGPSFMQQDKLVELGVLESIYFSGITFATIGYGDIAPCGIVRFVAMAEGLLGVVFASAIVVSLVRRYVE